jgi:hypothetical protein
MWSDAARRMVPQCRYAAVLVSGHGSTLFERRDVTRMEPQAAERVQEFLADQESLREELLASLRADAATAAFADEATVRRNRRLVWTWDALSLALLLDWSPYQVEAVPAAAGEVEVAVRAGRAGTVALDPWPFAAPRLTVRSEGRRLGRRFDDEEAMRAGLAAAPWLTLEFELAAP